MNAMMSQITGVTIVYSTVCPGAEQRKHQSSASLAFVRGNHRWQIGLSKRTSNAGKMFPHDDNRLIGYCSTCAPTHQLWKKKLEVRAPLRSRHFLSLNLRPFTRTFVHESKMNAVALYFKNIPNSLQRRTVTPLTISTETRRGRYDMLDEKCLSQSSGHENKTKALHEVWIYFTCQIFPFRFDLLWLNEIYGVSCISFLKWWWCDLSKIYNIYIYILSWLSCTWSGIFWVLDQPMRDDVTSSPIGWAHTQNDQICTMTTRPKSSY